jgi:hypothetical protein
MCFGVLLLVRPRAVLQGTDSGSELLCLRDRSAENRFRDELMRQAVFAFGFALLDGEIADLGGLLERCFFNVREPGSRAQIQCVSDQREAVGDVLRL